MRFVYEYRTSDNVVHSAEISAIDRDAAFKALKAKGIRPARLAEAPGLLNKLLGKGKRWFAIIILSVLAAFFALMWRDEREEMRDVKIETPRHQIYGDPAIMAALEVAGFTNVFAGKAECFLARFAQPGIISRLYGRNWRDEMATSLDAMDLEPVVIESGDCREVAELKRIVNGMKTEYKRYMANGNGTSRSYVRRVEERQVREYQIYENAKKDLEKGNVSAELWMKKNDELRASGLRTIPMKQTEIVEADRPRPL